MEKKKYAITEEKIVRKTSLGNESGGMMVKELRVKLELWNIM